MDLVVWHEQGGSGPFTLYEIKTASSARQCIREALGQLLEYGFWPGEDIPTGMVVVGEPPLDPHAKKYLTILEREFSLSLRYESLPLD